MVNIENIGNIPHILIKEISKIYLGQNSSVKFCVAAFLAQGHLLLEDVPGVGKTTLAKTIASCAGMSISRIQCTPDLLPSDVIGFSLPQPPEGKFVFKKGPIFSNIILVDEINRAAPRTQSAFLEAMEEKQVTIEGETRVIPRPFFLIATQNPVEIAGTFPLPESQLDRFLMRLKLGYPSLEGEMQLLKMKKISKPTINKVVTPEDIIEFEKLIDNVKIAESLLDYILGVGNISRKHPTLRIGISPRGLISWVKVSKVLAIINGRNYVSPEDLHDLAQSILSHRLVPNPEHRGLATIDTSEILSEILESVPLPL
jgi:MoxR-like ATPase